MGGVPSAFLFLHAFHKFAHCLFHIRSVRPAFKKFRVFCSGMGIPILHACRAGRRWRHGSVPVQTTKPCVHTNQRNVLYTSVHTSTYQYILACTTLYLCVLLYTNVYCFSCRILSALFCPGTRKYIISINCHAIVHTDIYAPVPTKVRCIGF